jgi:hypothetical protein
MSSMQKKKFSKLFLLTGLFVLGGSFLFSGCATAPKTLNPAISGPQLIVNPDSISLGVATLSGTAIVFEGSGFKPDDSVFIALSGPSEADVVVADGKVGTDGKFKATVSTLAKVTGILKGTVSGKYAPDGKYDQFIVITQPPIPAGTYTARATGMLYNQTAETTIVIKNPSDRDIGMDHLAIVAGKLVDKRPK